MWGCGLRAMANNIMLAGDLSTFCDIQIITLATVNNISITNIDLKDEMLIIRALNNFKEIDKNTLQQSAFQGLVDQATKEIEITINKIEIKEAITTQTLTNLKKKLNDNGIKSKRIFNKIKKK